MDHNKIRNKIKYVKVPTYVGKLLPLVACRYIYCDTSIPPHSQLASFYQLSDDIKELTVINLLLQQSHKDVMVDVVKVAFYIELNKPLGTCPVPDFFQCGVT